MSGLLNKAKEMLGGGHHEETGNTNTHGSHHETGHSSDTTVGTTGDADKFVLPNFSCFGSRLTFFP